MMELEQESAEKFLCTSVDFINPKDVQAMYIINNEYYILLTTGVNLMVTEPIYLKAISMLKKYYASTNEYNFNDELEEYYYQGE